jgi:hypothetical protein
VLFNRALLLASAIGATALVTAPICAEGVSQPTTTVNSVIELFTSQGCSSCPAADRLLATLARKADIVAVSFPVDYWDYNGWKDTLASPAFTARQKAYAAVHGDRHIYTPEAIIDGLTEAVGSNREEIERAIAATKGVEGAMTIPLRLVDTGARLLIEVAAGDGGPAGLFLLRVLRAKTVHIGRGENAGKVITYTNVVRKIEKLGDWTGESATFEMPVSRDEEEGYVVLLQRGALERPGVILAAAKTPGL